MAISYSTRRINPITGAVSSRLLTENLTVAEFDFLPGVYGVQTTDGIVQGTLEVSEIGTGGADFVVVSTSPSAGQVASIYTSGFNPQGLLIFNSADNGKNVVVSYRGYGTTTSYENLVALMNSLIDDSTLRYDLDSLAAYVATLTNANITSWTSFTMSIEGTTTNPSKASSPDIDAAYWRRVGDSMEIVYTYKHSSTTGAGNGSGGWKFMLPGSYTIDTAKISTAAAGIGVHIAGVCGTCAIAYGTNYPQGTVHACDSADAVLLCVANSSSNPTVQADVANWGIANDASYQISFRAVVPISGW